MQRFIDIMQREFNNSEIHLQRNNNNSINIERNNSNRNINIQRNPNPPSLNIPQNRISNINNNTIRFQPINNNNFPRINTRNEFDSSINDSNENLHFPIHNNNHSPIIRDIDNYLTDDDFNNIFGNSSIPNLHRPSINNLYDLNLNINNDRIIPWLKKEKFTEIISIKYGKDIICSICQEDINKGDIHITKCDHIFHYKCISECINRDINECPNCRSNIRTGERKRIPNINNLYEHHSNYYNIINNEINLRRNSSENNEINIRQREIQPNNIERNTGNTVANFFRSLYGRIRNFFG
jgi:hypothetical protein